MSTVLVTGSTGNVGSLVVERLLLRGVDVHAAITPRFLRDAEATMPLASVVLDFEDPSTFAEALGGVDTVFLLRPPHMSAATAMRPFIDAMVANSIKQVVFLSVQGAGGNPFVPHHGIERYLKKSGLAWTFLRPSFFMQNLTTTHAADIAERDEVFVPAGNGRTNFIDAADIAEAAAVVLAAAGHEGRSYELTGSEALTYGEVAVLLTEACGRHVTYSRPSAREFKARMTSRGYDDEFVSVMGSIYLLAKLGMAAGTTNELERLIGRKPTTFREFAKRSARCFAAAESRLRS